MYRFFVFKYQLPYRLFLDDGVYYVLHKSIRWRVTLGTAPRTRISTVTPAFEFGDRTQIFLDNHGFSGLTTVRAAYPLEPPMTREQITARQVSAQRVHLSDSLGAVNRIVAQYRAQTNEFWFRPLGSWDIPAFSTFLVPVEANQMEWSTFQTNMELASGYPYLKRESWYADFLRRLAGDVTMPFTLELLYEGQDALARDNLRLAATNFALSVEALFRALLLEYFPDEDVTRPVDQMLGSYFRRYREIGDPEELPIRKKEARRYLQAIWEPRDLLLHGHDVDLTHKAVGEALRALTQLLLLWGRRPDAAVMPIDGPFARGPISATKGMMTFPPRQTEELLNRAESRYRAGNMRDSEEAARFALAVDDGNVEAMMMLGLIAMKREDFKGAVEWFASATEQAPDWEPARHNLSVARAALETQDQRDSENARE